MATTVSFFIYINGKDVSIQATKQESDNNGEHPDPADQDQEQGRSEQLCGGKKYWSWMPRHLIEHQEDGGCEAESP